MCDEIPQNPSVCNASDTPTIEVYRFLGIFVSELPSKGSLTQKRRNVIVSCDLFFCMPRPLEFSTGMHFYIYRNRFLGVR